MVAQVGRHRWRRDAGWRPVRGRGTLFPHHAVKRESDRSHRRWWFGTSVEADAGIMLVSMAIFLPVVLLLPLSGLLLQMWGRGGQKLLRRNEKRQPQEQE